jgi:hypothetical protein
MVKIKVTLPDPPEADGSLKGSSPVRGNAYAGFLGGWGLATVPGYPTLIAESGKNWGRSSEPIALNTDIAKISACPHPPPYIN